MRPLLTNLNGRHNSYFGFWAKASGNDSGWHPLICHMLDTCNVVEAMWETYFNEGIKSNFTHAGELDESDTKQAVAFWAGLHDIGKATPVFQRKKREHKDFLSRYGLVFPAHMIEADHGTLGYYLLRHRLTSFSKNISSSEKKIADRISELLGGHHGIFPRPTGTMLLSGSAGDKTWDDAREELIDAYTGEKLLDDIFMISIKIFNNNPSLILMAGITSVADWIASNVECFRYECTGLETIDIDLDEYGARSKHRARQALDELGWSKPERGEVLKREFYELFPGKKPRPLQEKVIALAKKLRGKSMVIIEAPMGEGKTEAALYLADCLMQKNKQQGLYMALPTQATSNQMFGRIVDFLRVSYPSAKSNLHLLHSNSFFEETYREIRLESVENENEDAVVIASEWFIPKKRTLLASYGVGTVDQAILSILQTRHFFVRLFGLASKTVIFDEIHAYDAYTTTLIERLIEWLAAVNCNIILLSATLQANKKRALLRAYDPSIKELPKSAYPAVIEASENMVEIHEFDPIHKNKLIGLKWIKESDINSRLGEIIGDSGRVAIICNTVVKAQTLFQSFRRNDDFTDADIRLLHARFLLKDRMKLEKYVLDKYGPSNPTKGPSILISTQIIEQSLDLDFDLMISELAPVDLILQRMGRLHRHDIKRPERLKDPDLWIIEPEVNEQGMPDFGGSGYIYDHYVLYKTYWALKDLKEIEVPGHLSSLVSVVYDNGEIAGLSEEETALLNQYREESEASIRDLEAKAKNNLIRNPGFTGNILNESFRDLVEDDSDVHPLRQAMTRYGHPTVRTVCLRSNAIGGDHPKLRIKPDLEEARELILNSVPVSHGGIVAILKDDKYSPKSWGKCPALRNYKCLVFIDNKCPIQNQNDNYELELNNELGLIINKSS